MGLEVKPPSDPDASTNLGDLFRLHKQTCGQQLEAACRLVTPARGWELRLAVAGSLQRSQICRTQDEVLDTSEQWKAAMIDTGWQ
jgi:GTP cyclohydrolase II